MILYTSQCFSLCLGAQFRYHQTKLKHICVCHVTNLIEISHRFRTTYTSWMCSRGVNEMERVSLHMLRLRGQGVPWAGGQWRWSGASDLRLAERCARGAGRCERGSVVGAGGAGDDPPPPPPSPTMSRGFHTGDPTTHQTPNSLNSIVESRRCAGTIWNDGGLHSTDSPGGRERASKELNV